VLFCGIKLDAMAPAVSVLGCAFGILVVTGCGADANFGPVADARAVANIRRALSEDGEAARKEATVTSTGTGWATLRGQFVFDGTPPQMAPYNVTKEQGICSPDGQAPAQETLVVDSGSGGIKNVAIYLRDAPRVHDSAKATTEPVLFDQKMCLFLTHVLGVTVGQTIEIKNSDPTGHNTNIMGAKNKFNQTIPEGGSISFVPQKEEAMPAAVTCSIHPWMSAYILPRENSYYAITTKDGAFEIANVPAGEELEFQVWHESGRAAGNGLVGTVPDSPDVKVDKKGRFKVTLQPDEVKEIKVVVPASALRG